MKASGTQLFKNCSQTNFKMPRNFVPEVNKHLQKMKNRKEVPSARRQKI
jgi:hypothetical protein